MPIERKLAAIMFTDIVGFTKIMGDDETTALSILENQQSLINPIVEEHKGTIIKKMGDGLLIEFPSTVEAVECATQMQDSIKSYNTNDDNLEFHIRIGIHLGDIVIIGDDILGNGVNIASRIEPLASPDGICITDAVYQSVKSKLKLDAKRIDEVDLKHIDDKYTIYKIPDKEDIETENLNIYKTKIEIEKIKIVSKDIKNIINRVLFIFTLTYFFYIGGNILGGYFNEEKTFTRTIEILSDVYSLHFILFILLCLLWSFLFTFMSIRNMTIISFKDIRNVGSIMDILVTQMDYEYYDSIGNEIIYLGREFPEMLNTLDVLVNKIEYFKKMKLLSCIFDGNRMTIAGQNWSVRSLVTKISKYSV